MFMRSTGKARISFTRLLPQIGNGFVTGLARRGDKIWGTADAEMFSLQQRAVAPGGGFSGTRRRHFTSTPIEPAVFGFARARESPIVGVARLQPDGTVRHYEEGEGLDNRILVVKESARGRIYAAGIYLKPLVPLSAGERCLYQLSLPFPAVQLQPGF